MKQRCELTRREALKTVGAGACAALCGPLAGRAMGGEGRNDSRKKPNILFVFTDQQHARMMSCAGNPWLKTPAMDSLAAHGTRFERCYTTNPVCVPARVGMMTGRFPDTFGVRHNHSKFKGGRNRHEVSNTTIATQLAKAGYDLAYGGKVHLPGALNPKRLGFEYLTKDREQGLAKACAAYVKRDHKKPFYLVASFINPHDICFMAIAGLKYRDRRVKKAALADALKRPDGVTQEEFLARLCPPLPPNYEPQKDEPKAVQWALAKRAFRKAAREQFTDEDWRLHRWAYARLTERVDVEIGTLLDAIKASRQQQDTVVIFSSDHGDNDASFRMEHKTTFNEESANVPFIVMDGRQKVARVDSTHLVSNGLDLLPTVLDYAGVPNAQADPRGRSLRPLVEGQGSDWRATLGVESQIGRMVVAERYKYIRYDAAGDEQRLHDLQSDPHERTHVTNEPAHAADLETMRHEFAAWFPRHADQKRDKRKPRA